MRVFRFGNFSTFAHSHSLPFPHSNFHSHSRTQIIHCPFPFPWDSYGKNGKREFPLPMNTSSFFNSSSWLPAAGLSSTSMEVDGLPILRDPWRKIIVCPCTFSPCRIVSRAELQNLKEIFWVPIIFFFYLWEQRVWFLWKSTVHSISRRRRHMKYDWLGLGRIWLAAAASWQRLRWLLSVLSLNDPIRAGTSHPRWCGRCYKLQWQTSNVPVCRCKGRCQTAGGSGRPKAASVLSARWRLGAVTTFIGISRLQQLCCTLLIIICFLSMLVSRPTARCRKSQFNCRAGGLGGSDRAAQH